MHLSALLAWLSVVICAAGLPSVALAFGVSPIQVEMTSAGRMSRAQVTVTNDGATAVPVELAIERITLDERGQRKSSPAGENFLVFPPQALIAPGATQVFRLQWAGEPQLARSESFMVYVNQIPVRLQNVRHAVQVVSSMGVVVNVAPPSGMPDLKLVGTSVVKEKGKRFPAITVENPTNIHALLPESKIVLTAGSWSRTIEPNEISTQIGVGLVEPGKRRRFVLPVDLPPGVGQIHASVEFKPSRR